MISQHHIVGGRLTRSLIEVGAKYMHNNNKKYEKYYYTPSHCHKLIIKHNGGYIFKMLTPNVEVRETTSVLLTPFTVVRQSVSC